MAKKLAPKKPSLTVQLPKDLNASYANIVNIQANKNEVFFDFIIRGPAGEQDVKVASRVILSSKHAKDFSKVLSDFIKRLK